jgi:nucleotide-binding universal stress UspA family protein
MVEQKEIDLLVLSTYGRSGVQKALVGSVAEYMFRHAACPVLTVGPAVVAKSRDAGEFNRILYATDFSPESLTAAPYAISLAREHHAQLILMHCIGRDEDVEGMHRALANLDPLAADLIAEPDCIVERGRPVEKILEVAEGHAVDLIVLGIRPANGKRFELEQFLHPGVLRIVSQATCPVLTVRG